MTAINEILDLDLPSSTASTMSVMVVAVVSSVELSGVPRHAVNLARCLLLQPEVSAVHMVIAPWQSSSVCSGLPLDDSRLKIHEVPAGRSSIGRNLWFLNQLPLFASALAVDIVHLAYPLPVKRSAFACPVVVTLHDLYPYDIPSNFGFPKVLFNRAILRRCLQAVDAVACVSESTFERLEIHAPEIALQKASMIYNCIDADFIVEPTSIKSAWQGCPFLLCVAQHRRNKNVVLAMEVFERLLRAGDIAVETRLIVVGIDGPESTRIRRFISRSGLTGRIILVRGLSDAELDWCYGHCELLLAPSSIEGFGYPILEAMMHHCRIVCSDIPAFREVGGSYCHYADLQHAPQKTFVEAARRALASHKFRPVPIERFSGTHVSQAYLKLYTQVRKAIAGDESFKARNEDLPPVAAMPTKTQRPKANVLGMAVDAVDMEGALECIAEELESARKGYVCLAGVYGAMEAHRHRDLARIWAGASLVAPDGMPMVWVGRHQGHREMQRVAGPDLMLEVIKREEFRSFTHFLCGGKEGVAPELEANLRRRFPFIKIVGTYTPPFGPMSRAEELRFVDQVNSLRPDIIWVGISTPKQDRFIARYLPLLDTRLMFGVGAAFDFHTGRISDCAEWIKQSGLQWLHRLIQDPRHLWKRHLRNNPAFIWAIFLQLTGIKSYSRLPKTQSLPSPEAAVPSALIESRSR